MNFLFPNIRKMKWYEGFHSKQVLTRNSRTKGETIQILMIQPFYITSQEGHPSYGGKLDGLCHGVNNPLKKL